MTKKIKSMVEKVQGNQFYRGIGYLTVAVALGVAAVKGMDYLDSLYERPIMQEESQFQRNLDFSKLEALPYEVE